MKKWLREPLLHFILIGGGLFILYGLQNDGFENNNNRIVINETDIDRLITLWQKKRQRLPTQAELNGMVEQQIREEVMYREALAMGLEHNDPIVRRRLAQKVEFITSDLAEQVEPSEAELNEYLIAHAEIFEVPARVDFIQLYYSVDKRGADTQRDALALLDKLKQSDPKIDTSTMGDAFMFGQQHEQLSRYEVSRLFGEDFANQLFALPVGDWQGPVFSGYGLHLVRIENKNEAEQPELAEVSDKVRIEWLAERRSKMDEAIYQSLRQRYEIVIDDVSVKETTSVD